MMIQTYENCHLNDSSEKFTLLYFSHGIYDPKHKIGAITRLTRFL